MTFLDHTLDRIGTFIARRISQQPQSSGLPPGPHAHALSLTSTLEPGDVLLVSSDDKVSTAIKFLTQSTWSHAALYVGDTIGVTTEDGEPHTLIEVNLGEGCVSAPLSKYAQTHTRICRPIKLHSRDRASVIEYMRSRIGQSYDLRNVLDLARYLIPTPPVPSSWRRRMISLGSGSPTRAICSSMIAAAFQSVRYPILPDVELIECANGHSLRTGHSFAELFHIRHHSLFVPADFDTSPFFDVVKPTVSRGFDYQSVAWSDVRNAEQVACDCASTETDKQNSDPQLVEDQKSFTPSKDWQENETTRLSNSTRSPADRPMFTADLARGTYRKVQTNATRKTLQ